MASYSSLPPPTIDLDNVTENDDEFDWEAAVREIDSACQGVNATAAASTSGREQPSRPGPAPPANNAAAFPIKFARPATGATRQSTLDRFVGRNVKFQDGGSGLDRAEKDMPCGCAVGNDLASTSGGGDDGRVAVDIDLEAAKTWIYPVNVPLRDYQFSITKKALFSNTLVAIPTGLGKTLIAAVVMYNYFRWFPKGKIVFAAPSRPLVVQQIKACHETVGIPQDWTVDMTGQTTPPKRSELWNAKRVFFVTPQVLEKDILSGICLMKQIVCLVIDEAHRASGNYSYCVAVRELMAVPVQLRILALTATPGSKQQTVQNVINNLHISTLEYHNEADHNVSPYVHNRKVELIKIAMGRDVDGINDLLLEAIKPHVHKLCSIGALQNRDLTTLNPCELLNAKEKFTNVTPDRVPPSEKAKYLGIFGILITLYHIRKLLSSHGIGPAYEMLDDKLKGSIARLCNNESICKARGLMMKSLSHGAPNPKLLKLIEILTDHFKSKDPKDSRVMIFSSFRSSVKEIMVSLSQLGELIKAMEFIGQSSGKSLKGQSQKVQQAVLEKFRTGGYNVIVATSIGEEGLNIKEVDLVICFDANISPLRMIQRMGRTGRKHDGRVVVLAFEGSELKGYLRKQASAKTIGKHMHDGGTKSFCFQSSPRMVPHICKPEVQFVKLSIGEFVPRGIKLKDVSVHRSPLPGKLSSRENDLIMRYFHHSNEDRWKPSLIAFPHFQAFPSRVHTVRHSYKTIEMFIETAQHLQGLPSTKAKTAVPDEAKDYLMQPIQVSALANDENYATAPHADSVSVHQGLQDSKSGVLLFDESYQQSSKSIAESHMPGLAASATLVHHFLFDTNVVTVDSLGGVLITSIPTLPFTKEALASKIALTRYRTGLLDSKKEVTSPLEVCITQYDKSNMLSAAASKLTDPCELRCIYNNDIFTSQSHIFEKCVKEPCTMEEIVLQTPAHRQKMLKPEDNGTETSETEKVNPSSLPIASVGIAKDMDLSPRLTHFIEEGIVPESPIVQNINHVSRSDPISPRSIHGHGSYGLPAKCPSRSTHQNTNLDDKEQDLTKLPKTPGKGDAFDSPGLDLPNTSNKVIGFYNKLSSPNETDVKAENSGKLGFLATDKICTPIVNQANNSPSDDWQLASQEILKSVEQVPKYKRLRKYGDIIKKLPSMASKENFSNPATNLCRLPRRNSSFPEKRGGVDKEPILVDFFIEEEAEVSVDADVSEDEEDSKDEDTYDDSFIDDRVNPTEASTQADNSVDMMAFYRRSLLTQTSLETPPSHLASSVHEPVSARAAENGSCSSERMCDSLQTPQICMKSAYTTDQNSASHKVISERASLLTSTGANSKPEGVWSTSKSRKRKLSFQCPESAHATQIHPEFFQTNNASKPPFDFQPKESELKADMFYDDDDFYKSLDLDALELHATKLLRHKSGISVTKEPKVMSRYPMKIMEDPKLASASSPSFDLGI